MSRCAERHECTPWYPPVASLHPAAPKAILLTSQPTACLVSPQPLCWRSPCNSPEHTFRVRSEPAAAYSPLSSPHPSRGATRQPPALRRSPRRRSMLKVLLVRHAQCEMNLVVNERIGGRTNHSPLTSLGEQQARALGAHLRAVLQRDGIAPQLVQFHSSTAVRALDTARIVMEAVQVGPPPCLAGAARPRAGVPPPPTASAGSRVRRRARQRWRGASSCWSWSRVSGRALCGGTASRPS